jgi:NADH:ubiquinone oxidoreductase subunit
MTEIDTVNVEKAVAEQVKEGEFTTINEFPRRERPNPHNFTEEQIARRDLEVRACCEKHPTVPEKWIEWMWDICEKTPEEELKNIVNNKLWEKPVKERITEGVIQSLEVLPPGTDLAIPLLKDNENTTN